MSITDELREWYRDRIFMANGWAEIDTIADRIDSAHRAALEKLAAQVDESEDGWMRMPVDADGVPIHVGDVMEWVTYDDTYESVIRTVDGVGTDVFFAWSNDRAGHAQYEAQAYRHHHKPTVEDVLREFAREIDADAYGITDAKVAEFAAKLRLAGEDE